ncbi:MAG: PIN/TRAM domain-containing protein [Bacillota bacterium]
MLQLQKSRPYFTVFGALSGGAAGFYLIGPIGRLLKTELGLWEGAGIVLFAAALAAVILFFLGPHIARLVVAGIDWIERRVVRLSLTDIMVGVGGLIVGLIIANLLAPSLARIPVVGSFLPSIVMVILAYIGIAVARSKKDDLVAISPGRLRQAARARPTKGGDKKGDILPTGQSAPKLLDTSTIIDGRIVDICKSGFVEGPIVIPHFVLDELRRIADSADNLKRSKGRRGLDTLNTLQKDVSVGVLTWEWPTDSDQDVDSLLLKMCKATGAEIITTDYNLAKIAELQQVGVLNVNQLANALKLMVAPGEELMVEVHREGKQPGQGVGYLDDGTMVVIEQARKHLNEVISVIVTNVHSTAQGRMIFAKPKYLERGQAGE